MSLKVYRLCLIGLRGKHLWHDTPQNKIKKCRFFSCILFTRESNWWQTMRYLIFSKAYLKTHVWCGDILNSNHLHADIDIFATIFCVTPLSRGVIDPTKFWLCMQFQSCLGIWNLGDGWVTESKKSIGEFEAILSSYFKEAVSLSVFSLNNIFQAC